MRVAWPADPVASRPRCGLRGPRTAGDAPLIGDAGCEEEGRVCWAARGRVPTSPGPRSSSGLCGSPLLFQSPAGLGRHPAPSLSGGATLVRGAGPAGALPLRCVTSETGRGPSSVTRGGDPGPRTWTRTPTLLSSPSERPRRRRASRGPRGGWSSRKDRVVVPAPGSPRSRGSKPDRAVRLPLAVCPSVCPRGGDIHSRVRGRPRVSRGASAPPLLLLRLWQTPPHGACPWGAGGCSLPRGWHGSSPPARASAVSHWTASEQFRQGTKLSSAILLRPAANLRVP